jgi:glycosyltransferase involved in cell wall biosynthesis
MFTESLDLTVVIPCKGRLAMLKSSLPKIAVDPRIQLVVVDSCCPDGAGDWVASNHPSVKVVSLDDSGRFNIAATRNAGAAVVTTRWLFFLDTDVVLSDEFFNELAPLLDSAQFLLFERKQEMKGAFGSCVVPMQAFLQIGGWDEVFEGYGEEDDDFQFRLKQIGLAQSFLPATLIETVIRHSGEDSTRFYQEKNRRFSMTRNLAYRLLKQNRILLGESAELDLETRKDLFATVDRALRAACAKQADRASIQIEIPFREAWVGAYVTRQALTLEVDVSSIGASSTAEVAPGR